MSVPKVAAVIGAGTMGPGMAAVLARAGSEVRLYDISAEVLERARAKLKGTTWLAFYHTMVEQRPAAEVAAVLNLSVASVYKATYRVKQMLLQEYRHVHPSGSDSRMPKPGDAREAPAG